MPCTRRFCPANRVRRALTINKQLMPGCGFMLDRLVDHDDWVAFADPQHDVRLGGTALFAASLLHRRRATNESVHDETIHAALRFLMAQQDETGAPAAFWSPSTELPVPDRFGPFATGEAAC